MRENSKKRTLGEAVQPLHEALVSGCKGLVGHGNTRVIFAAPTALRQESPLFKRCFAIYHGIYRIHSSEDPFLCSPEMNPCQDYP